jgi:hypothetical protein
VHLKYAKSKRTATQTTPKITWCPWRESDPRPLPYQGSALPLSHMGAYRLSHTDLNLERGTGIEPAALAWKARVLPLYEPRIRGSLGICLTSTHSNLLNL